MYVAICVLRAFCSTCRYVLPIYSLLLSTLISFSLSLSLLYQVLLVPRDGVFPGGAVAYPPGRVAELQRALRRARGAAR